MFAQERGSDDRAAAEHLDRPLRHRLVAHRGIVAELRAVLLKPSLETFARRLAAASLAKEPLPLEEHSAEADALAERRGLGADHDLVLLADRIRRLVVGEREAVVSG